jgi:hypothetical protein
MRGSRAGDSSVAAVVVAEAVTCSKVEGATDGGGVPRVVTLAVATSATIVRWALVAR